MQGDIVAQGVELMLYGMGTVIVFLALLVVATTAMSRCVGRYFPEPEVLETGSRPDTQPRPSVDDGQLLAVISAALHQHRKRRK